MDNLVKEQHKAYELARIPIDNLNDLYKLGFKLIPLRQDSKTPNISSTNDIYNNPKYWSEEKLRNNHHLFYNVATVFGKSHIIDADGNDLYLNVLDVDSKNVFTRLAIISANGKQVYFIDELCNSTFVTKTKRGHGYHIYWFSHRRNKTIRTAACKLGWEFEIKTDNSSGHCTLPPSIHRDDPDFHYQNVGRNRIYVNDKLYDGLLDLLSDCIREKPSYTNHSNVSENEPSNELDSSDSLQIASVVANAYRNGTRNDIIFQLSGFLWHANIKLETAETIVKYLCRITDDEETDNRLEVVRNTYAKAKNGEPVTGRGGLSETFERVVGSESANKIVRDISNILNKYQNPVLSQLDPNIRDELSNYIFETICYDPLTLVVAHAVKKQTLTCKPVRYVHHDLMNSQKPESLRFGEVVINATPDKIIRYENPINNNSIKYKIEFCPPFGRPFTVGPKTVAEIVSELKMKGQVYKPRIAEEYLNATLNGAQRAHKVTITREIETPGFYYVDGKIIASNINIHKPSTEEIRKCVEFLNELIRRSKHPEILVTEIKWGMISPFSFVFKQLSLESKERWIPWLYLDGHTHTSKTTDGTIILAIYGKHKAKANNVGFAHTDNIARLGEQISNNTFPILIDEVKLHPVLQGDMIEAIKHAAQSLTARKKLTVSSEPIYIPALSACIFTSNNPLPADPALHRRFLHYYYPRDDEPTEIECKEFELFLKPNLNALGTLGDFTVDYLLSKQEIIINEENDWPVIARTVLEEFCKAVDMPLPNWVDMIAVGDQIEDVEAEEKQIIRSFFVKKINDAFSRNYRAIQPRDDQGVDSATNKNKPIEERLNFSLDNQLIPFMRRKNVDSGEILVTIDILKEMKSDGIGYIHHLTDLARMLGAEIKPTKLDRKTDRLINTSVAKLMEFIDREE